MLMVFLINETGAGLVTVCKRQINKDKPIISVKNLTKSFGSQKVLNDLNLEVYPGEIMVIMGGSGCGKSTLLRHMIGSHIPDSGSVELFGSDITVMSEKQLDEIRKRFGILFQSGALFNSMTVGENVKLPLIEHTDLDEETIDIMVKIKLEQVSLRNHSEKMPAMLSGGMKKRAGLARAIALDPEILFYDEPSAGLDPVTSAQIDQLIIDLTRKLEVTSVVVTHEMDSAFSIADRMCMLDRGKIIKIGPKSDFERIRHSRAEELIEPEEKLMHQFLCGLADGPLSSKEDVSCYVDDLLGVGYHEEQ